MQWMKLLAKPLTALAYVLMRDTWCQVQQRLIEAQRHYQKSLRHDLPEALIVTLIAAEDHRFYEHAGVDFRAVVRAMWRNLTSHTLEGGSTIEQQLVRQLTGQRARSVRRKVREILLACLVDTLLPKAEIPGIYLSVAYYGWGMNGVQQACEELGILMSEITETQAAEIIARLKYPQPSVMSAQRELQIVRRAVHILRRCGPAVGRLPGLRFDMEAEQSEAVSDQ